MRAESYYLLQNVRITSLTCLAASFALTKVLFTMEIERFINGWQSSSNFCRVIFMPLSILKSSPRKILK